jgi:aubergine
MNPERRKARLLEFTSRLHRTDESMKQLLTYQTDISEELVKFKGRALKQEVMCYGNGVTSQNDDKVDWTNPMKMNSMYSSIPLKRWAFVYPKKTGKESQDFIEILLQVAKGMNYDMAEPKKIELPDDRTATYVNTLNDVLAKDPKMVMVIVPNNAADRYAAIKKLTCVGRAVPTQVIVQKTMMPKKGNMGGVRSIATKVMIQINCKVRIMPGKDNREKKREKH